MRLRATLTLGLATLCMLLLAPFVSGSVAAGAYPVTTCSTLAISATNPLVGESVTVSGSGFTANASVRLELHSAPLLLKTVVADAGGAFTTQVTLPADVTGRHDIVATTGAVSSSSCPVDPFQSLDIQADSSTNGGNGGGGGGLSSTGIDIAGLLALAAVLVGVGVLLNRRKTRVGSR